MVMPIPSAFIINGPNKEWEYIMCDVFTNLNVHSMKLGRMLLCGKGHHCSDKVERLQNKKYFLPSTKEPVC